MEIHVSPAGMRILEHLIGFSPKTISELMKELEVTRTAVTEQLNELVSSGYVQRVQEHREKRGRPQFRYTATDHAATQLLPGNQHLLVPAVWNSIESVGGEALLEKIIEKTSETLASGCAFSDLSWTERVRCLVTRGGFEVVETLDENTVRVSKRTCGFFSMYESRGIVCKIHLQTIAKITGGTVERTSYRQEGAPCCEFLIRKK